MSVSPPVAVTSSWPDDVWARWAMKWRLMLLNHARLVVALRMVRCAVLWAALVLNLGLAVFWPPAAEPLGVYLSLLWLLALWFVLCRTKTVSWSTVSGVLGASMLWAVIIALISSAIVHDALSRTVGSFILPGSITAPGALIAVASIVEESLKVLPLAVAAVVAPSRLRAWAAADWLLIGMAIGLGFTAVEDMARRLGAAVGRPGLFDILHFNDRGPASGYAQYDGSPLGGWSLSTDSGTALFPGHHVLTAVVATALGLTVVLWRSSSVAARLVHLCALAAVWWLAVCVHAGFNATAVSYGRDWGSGPSPVPAPLVWGWSCSIDGRLPSLLLIIALVGVSLVDASRRRARRELVTGSRPSMPRVFGTVTLRFLVHSSISDLRLWLRAHRRRDAESRWMALCRGREMASALRLERRSSSLGSAPSECSVRGLAIVATAGLIVGVALLAPSYARVIGSDPLTSRLGSGWLPGVLDDLGTWWSDLGLPAQLVLTFAAAGLIGLTIGTWGTGLLVAGGAGYLLQHGHGLAAIARNPRAAVSDYLRRATPQDVLLDVGEAVLTFVPFGGSAAAGAQAGKALRWQTADALHLAEMTRRPVFTDSGGVLMVLAERYSPSELRMAQVMADRGMPVILRQAPPLADRTSDIVTNGVCWDVYTPKTSSVRNLIRGVVDKRDQVNGGGVIVDLSQTSLTSADLGDILGRVRQSTSRISSVIVVDGP